MERRPMLTGLALPAGKSAGNCVDTDLPLDTIDIRDVWPVPVRQADPATKPRPCLLRTAGAFLFLGTVPDHRRPDTITCPALSQSGFPESWGIPRSTLGQ